MLPSRQPYPRDLIGYGDHPPEVQWPGGARVAVQFVVNYEEGGENCVLHGDSCSEAFLSEITGAQPFAGVRHMNMESVYEYGARAGFWRLRRMFAARGLPVTVFGVAMALARNPAAVAAMKESGWELASHGWRWIDYSFMPPQAEREHLRRALEVHRQAAGAPPEGWYVGRVSTNTRALLLEMGEWLYDADSYADDLPYWVRGPKAPHLVVPYTLDANDMRFCVAPGFNHGEDFFIYLRDSYESLRAEDPPKMMSVGLHCRLAGRPGRALGLAKFLDHLERRGDAWICRRADIARHWRRHHPPPEGWKEGRVGVGE